jgi:hypothetical protein
MSWDENAQETCLRLLMTTVVEPSTTSCWTRVAPSEAVNLTGLRMVTVSPTFTNSFLYSRWTLLAATRLFSSWKSASLAITLGVSVLLDTALTLSPAQAG